MFLFSVFVFWSGLLMVGLSFFNFSPDCFVFVFCFLVCVADGMPEFFNFSPECFVFCFFNFLSVWLMGGLSFLIFRLNVLFFVFVFCLCG